MFGNRYLVKVYKEGEHVPHISFEVVATHATQLDNHALKFDGAVVMFPHTEYVVCEALSGGM